MKPNAVTAVAGAVKSAAGVLVLGAVSSCQPTGSSASEEAQAAAATPEATAPDTTAKRPAPDFFVVPQDMLKKRVWICEDEVSDIFHVQHDCPVLVECKGKGTFRNLLLPRAIEAFGRYNCQECSKDLDIIFDKDAVRTIGG